MMIKIKYQRPAIYAHPIKPEQELEGEFLIEEIWFFPFTNIVRRQQDPETPDLLNPNHI